MYTLQYKEKLLLLNRIDGQGKIIRDYINKRRMENINIACMNGQIDIVKYLINKNRNDIPFLISLASSKGHLNIVKYLISLQNKDINIINQTLRSACAGNHIHIIDYLLSIGGRLTDDCVRYSSAEGHLHVLKHLISLGVNINYAIPWASSYGKLFIVKYLVSLGGDIDNTSIKWACEYGHLDTLKYLINKGGDANLVYDWRYYKEIENSHLSILKYLSYLGVKVLLPKNLKANISVFINKRNKDREVKRFYLSLCLKDVMGRI